MKIHKTVSLDLELVYELNKLKNQSQFIEQACIEKLKSTSGRVETKEGRSNVSRLRT